MRKRCMVIASVLMMMAVATAASASPFAGRVDTAQGTVHVYGSDGRPYAVELALVAARPAVGPAEYRLVVGVSACGHKVCAEPTNFVVPLDPDDVTASDDASATQVHTHFMGSALSASWQPDAAGVDVSANLVADFGHGSATAGTGDRPAKLVVSLLGTRCQTAALTRSTQVLTIDGYQLPAGPAAPRRPTSALTATRERSLTCAM